ncbi:putative copper resistance protein D [Desulfotomaculum arcticum]|uniref:Putative copper resistance protein D n=1 Tax=Desulfotruncus arcticus DSM 17038 TaxID=1121424 RepID=A0A1I2UI57_9FIRM|nr:hypothetical protein [Desulfotruncus arcticus]SFG76805.1 putative copper resistance protein D [Desulfotomaculum arcticum] [Desulfotruncus arcticus DSM 17038]
MEKILHSIFGSLHILAVETWIGSMIYSMFAVAPALKHLAPPGARHQHDRRRAFFIPHLG